MKILTICPTRGRPQIFKVMLDSFLTNSSKEHSTLRVYLDLDDPKKDEYLKICTEAKISFYMMKRRTITEYFNLEFTHKHQPSTIGMYHLSNDDFIYRTKDFDKIILEEYQRQGPGVYYGDDLQNGSRLCTGPFICARMAKAVGYLQLPTLTHLYNDNVWMAIGTQLGRLHYLPQVVIEHNHRLLKYGIPDETYKRTNSIAMYRMDKAAFDGWVNSGKMDQDIKKIEDKICGKS